MDGVATLEYRSGANRVKEELKAYWAVLLHTVLHTNMVALQHILCIAHGQWVRCRWMLDIHTNAESNNKSSGNKSLHTCMIRNIQGFQTCMFLS